MEFSELFQGYTEAHGIYSITGEKRAGKIGGEAKTIASPLSPEDWSRHLSGRSPGIGVIPLRDDGSTVRFAAIDIDDPNVNHTLLEGKLSDQKIQCCITKSKSGGAHVWFFFSEDVSAKIIRIKLAQVAAFLGYADAEIFPKQTARKGKHDLGNWINLPYFGETRVGILDGKEIGLSRFLELAESRLLTRKKFQALNTGQGKSFQDGPPCLQLLASRGIQEGERDNTLFNIAIYFKQKYPEGFEEHLFAFNKDELDKPLGSTQIQKIAFSVQAHEYYYRCHDEPLRSHCNKNECQTRQFGIGQFKGIPLAGIQIGTIDKLLTDPETFIIELNGNRFQLKSIDDLCSQAKMRKLCLSKLNEYPPPVPRNVWEDFIKDLGKTFNPVEVPFSSTPKGQFIEYVVEFCNRKVQPEKDAIANNGVWYDAESNRVYFNLMDLKSFLDREGFRDFTRNEIIAILQDDLNAESQDISIKGRRYTPYVIEGDIIQQEAFDVGKYKPAF